MVDEQVDPLASNQLNPLMESIENKLLVIAIGPAEWSSNHFIAFMSRGDRHDAFSRPGKGTNRVCAKDVWRRFQACLLPSGCRPWELVPVK